MNYLLLFHPQCSRFVRCNYPMQSAAVNDGVTVQFIVLFAGNCTDRWGLRIYCS
jgi:hypothetical protein